VRCETRRSLTAGDVVRLVRRRTCWCSGCIDAKNVGSRFHSLYMCDATISHQSDLCIMMQWALLPISLTLHLGFRVGGQLHGISHRSKARWTLEMSLQVVTNRRLKCRSLFLFESASLIEKYQSRQLLVPLTWARSGWYGAEAHKDEYIKAYYTRFQCCGVAGRNQPEVTTSGD
jgi:hypothetical protein